VSVERKKEREREREREKRKREREEKEKRYCYIVCIYPLLVTGRSSLSRADANSGGCTVGIT